MKTTSNIMAFDISSDGLDPTKNRITGITTKSDKEERVFTARDEKEILEKFWEYVKASGATQLVGYNSSRFDIPMLVLRSIRHGLEIPHVCRNSLDLRRVIFPRCPRHKGKLSDMQELLGITFPDSKYRKMHMSILWGTDDLPELKEFLLRDVQVTWSLYEHLREAGLID